MGSRVGPRVYAGSGCQPWVELTAVPIVAQYAHLAPTWCHEIEVLYRASGPGEEYGDDELAKYTLRIEPSVRYHRAELYVGGLWFEMEAREQCRCIVHEIGHLYFATLGHLAEHMIETLTDGDTALQDTLNWQREQAEEFGVEDFADLVCFLAGVE